MPQQDLIVGSADVPADAPTRRGSLRLSVVLPTVLALAVLIAGVVVWQLLSPWESERVRAQTEKTGVALVDAVGGKLRGIAISLLRQNERLNRPVSDAQDFQDETALYLRDRPGIIGIRHAIGTRTMQVARPGVDVTGLFSALPARSGSTDETKVPGYQQWLSPPVTWNGRLIYFLTYYSTAGNGDASVYTTALDASDWLGESILSEQLYDIVLLDGTTPVIDPHRVGPGMRAWSEKFVLDGVGRQWVLLVTPSASIVTAAVTHIPEFVLAGAALFALVIALATYLSIVARERKFQVDMATAHLAVQAAQTRAAEASRDLANQQLGSILESITDGFIVFDKDFRYRYLNNVATTVTGRDAADLIGRCIWDVFPEFGASPEADVLRAAMRDRTSVSLERLGAFNRFYSLRAYPHLDGLALYFHDITPQRHIADRLRESESLLKQAQSVAGIGSFTYLITKSDERWSEELLRLTGLESEEQRDERRFADFLGAEDRRRLAEIEAELGHGTYEKELKARLLRNDGETRAVAIRMRREHSEGHHEDSIVGTVQDMTERERVEANLALALMQSRQQSAKFRALNRAMLLISAKLGHPDLHQVLVEELRETVGAHIGILYLTGAGPELQVLSVSDKFAHWPHAATMVNSLKLLAESGRGGKSMRLSEEALRTNPIWAALNSQPAHEAPLRGLLSIPLHDRRGMRLGFLQACDRQEGEFTIDDEAVAVQFAQIASVAIGWGRLIDDLRKTQLDLSHKLHEIGRSRSLLAEAEHVAKLGSWEIEPSAPTEVKLSDEAARIVETGNETNFDVLAPRVDAEDIRHLRQHYRGLLNGEFTELDHEFRYHTSNGRKWLHLKARVVAADGEIPGQRIVGSLQDVTRQRADALQDRLNATAFAGIAAGVPIAQSLLNVIALYESRFPDGICSILLRDEENRMHTGAAPRLPDSYNDAIEGLVVGPMAGSCGTAVWRRERVVVTDTQRDPLWKDFAQLAADHGLRACWSTPIFDPARNVLGTFAVYYDQPRAPRQEELDCLDRAASVAAIAIGAQRSRQQIEDREQRFRSLFTYVPEAIFAVDMQGIVVDCNQAALRMTGFSREQLVNHPLAITVAPELRHVLASHIALAASGEPQQAELERVRPDGTLYTTVSMKTPIVVDGELVGIFSIVRDVTIERANQLALEDALRTVRGHNRELEEFAFVASHDLQEPLRKVRAFGDRLRLHLSDRADRESLDYIERMRAAAERMQRLIDDLLAYSRVAKRERQMKRIDLRHVLDGVLADLETSIEQKRAEVVCQSLPVVFADETQMRQLLQNLISNALKFAHGSRPPVITIRGETFQSNMGFDRRPWARLIIADNGIGFDNKYAERIFAAFQRLHGQGEYAGSGIGLAIVRRIVERHGGHIRATGVPGEGATFTIEIPLSGADKTLVVPEENTAEAQSI